MPFNLRMSLVAPGAILAACGGDLTLPGDGAGGPGPGATLSIADDRFTTLEGADRTLSVPAPGVLGNDRVNGSPSTALQATLITGPAHGHADLRADGSLVYVPEPGYFGPDAFTYRASLAGGGSADASVDLEVEPVNDSPEFTAGPDQEAKAGKGHGGGRDGEEDDEGREITVEHWATDLSAGPANESGQALSFLVEVVSGGESLAGMPSVSPAGTLSYTPSDREGTARVEVRLRDDGGTANGGLDTSPAHTLIIVVTH
jgi:hypothetical protein